MNDIGNLTSTLDVSRLLLMHAALSTLSATSPRATGYNLPIALFGLFVVDKTSTEGLRQFGALHALSFLLDIFWLLSGSRETGAIVTFLLLVNMFLKPVTLLGISSNLKQQGLPNIGSIAPGGFSQDQRGTTVWSADEQAGYPTGTPYQSRELDDDIEDLPQSPPRGGHTKGKESNGGYHTIG